MISIITGYYNRKNLFYQTLKSLTKSKFKDFEVIAVDDASSPEHRIEDFIDEFSFLNVIRINENQKWYIIPCVAFNIGLKEAQGDIIVLQNPECLHVHDVLSYINETVDKYNYITISTYGINNEINKIIPEHLENDTLVDYLSTLPQQPYIGDNSIGWYNHSKYRPVAYHFCSAMLRKNMRELNGFDERYAKGIGYDDDELLLRINRLGLKVIVEDNISVIHQYHDTVMWNRPNVKELTEKNKRLFYETTLKEKFKHKANNFKLWIGI